MNMNNRLTLARGGLIAVLAIASLAFGGGVAQARGNIPGRSNKAIRDAKKKQEANNGGHSIEVICAGKVSSTGSCGGGYWTDEKGVQVYHSGVHGGGGSSNGGSGHSSVKSHNPARHNLFPRRPIRRERLPQSVWPPLAVMASGGAAPRGRAIAILYNWYKPAPQACA